ncbi:MAG: hypothetical protein ABL904_12850, partial [Hyphomicrobiaceae bacterium]
RQRLKQDRSRIYVSFLFYRNHTTGVIAVIVIVCDHIGGAGLPICNSAGMTATDMARHDAPQPDGVRHTLTVRDVGRVPWRCQSRHM